MSEYRVFRTGRTYAFVFGFYTMCGSLVATPLHTAYAADSAVPPVPTTSDEISAQDLELIAQGLDKDEGQREHVGPDITSSGALGPNVASSVFNPDLAVILNVAAASYSHEPWMTGEHDPSASGFTLQQLELHLGANVDPYFRVDSNIVYGAHEVELEEAFATSLALPWNLQARVGQFLNRFGRLNSTHPHQWLFAAQPLVLGKFFGHDGSRGVGVEASWLMPTPWYAEWVLAVQGLPGRCCGRSFQAPIPSEATAERSLAPLVWTGALKQFFPLTPNLSVLWGLSGQTGPQSQGRYNVIAGTDLYLRWRPVASDRRQSLSLQFEGMWRRRHVEKFVGLALAQDWGGYAQLIWGIDALWEAGVRAETVSGLDQDALDPDWTRHHTRYALQTTYYPTHFTRIRVELLASRPGWVNHTVLGALATLEVVVGAHGAHTY